MSTERPLPPSRSTSTLKLVAYAVALAAAIGAVALVVTGRREDHTWEAVAAQAPGNTRVAFARARTCGAGMCQTLWIGPTREQAVLVSTLAAASERVDEIAWTADGHRVGFLINGYQLRLYDAETLSPAGVFSLITPDGNPSSRIARGVTFSANGKAVTFDDCPRRHSGCRAGLTAVPQ